MFLAVALENSRARNPGGYTEGSRSEATLAGVALGRGGPRWQPSEHARSAAQAPRE